MLSGIVCKVFHVCFPGVNPGLLLWYWRETHSEINCQFFSNWYLRTSLNGLFMMVFPHSFNYLSLLFLAFLGFSYLSAPFRSNAHPSSPYANTCFFGSYHLCDSDCNISHGHHREASLFIVSIFFPLVYWNYSLQTVISICIE